MSYLTIGILYLSDLEHILGWPLHYTTDGSVLSVHGRYLQRLLLQVYQPVWIIMETKCQVNHLVQ